MPNFKVGQKVKTQNAKVGKIIEKHPTISEAWNVEIERKFKGEKEKAIEYYFEEEITKF